MFKRVLYQLITVMILFFSTVSTTQGQDKFQDRKAGRVFVSWGWNRDAYGKSTISFKGADYDFRLEHLTAHDRPTRISYNNYLKFSRLTIPQTNLRVSYFFKDNLAISFGDDHMKYVMDNDQIAMMKGIITRPGAFLGEYDRPVKVTRDFLLFEHTDGLNYLNFELEKYADLFRPGKNVIFSWFFGGGAGVLMPKTNVTLLDYERNDRYHVSGFGISAKAGLMINFLKHIHIKLEEKMGYINMPDIILHKKGIPGRAHQSFVFNEFYGTIGFNLRLTKPHTVKNKK